MVEGVRAWTVFLSSTCDNLKIDDKQIAPSGLPKHPKGKTLLAIPLVGAEASSRVG